MRYAGFLQFILLLVGALHSPSCCDAQFVWQLNQSFSLNTSVSGPGLQLDRTQPDLFFFPFQPHYSIFKNTTSPVFAYLCFLYFTPTPPSTTKQYSLSICLDSAELTYNNEPTQVPAVVWTANRGSPLTGEVLSLTLQSDGNLVLQADDNRGQAWSSGTGNTSLGVTRLELTLSDRAGAGLVLLDSANESMWQSTDNPSDTLTDAQGLAYNSPAQRLTSWTSRTNTADGIYSFEVNPSGLVLYASFPARIPYWMWMVYRTCPATEASLANVSCAEGGLVFINLDYLGVNCWIGKASGGMVPSTCLDFASTGSDNLVNRTLLKMYWDGNLRAHTLQYSASEVTHRVTLLDVFSLKQCSLPLRCGPYSICRGTSSPQCECPANSTLFGPVDVSDPTQGCVLTQPLFSTCPNKAGNVSNGSTVTPPVMHRLEGIDYFYNAFSSPLPQFQTEEDCSSGCLQNCSCLAAFWYAHTLACYDVDQMGSLQKAENQSFVGFLKVNPSLDQGRAAPSSLGSERSNMSVGAIAAIVVSAVAASLVLVGSLLCFIAAQRRRLRYKKHHTDSEEDVFDLIPGLPTRFSYRAAGYN